MINTYDLCVDNKNFSCCLIKKILFIFPEIVQIVIVEIKFYCGILNRIVLKIIFIILF